VISDFAAGARYFTQGLRLINLPGIRRYAAIPVLIALVVLGVLVTLGATYFDSLLDWLLPPSDSWWSGLVRTVLWPLFAMASLLVLYFGFTVLANLFGAAFNGLLSEKVEARLRGQGIDTGGLGTALRDLVPATFNELRKLLYFVFWVVPLLLLFLVPGLQIIAAVLWAVFSAWMLAVEYGAYPMDNHRIRFPQARAALGQRRMLAQGFGAAVMVAMLIPVFNVLVMPAAVAGATAMYVDHFGE
jgi:CysZ protein